MNVNQLLGRMSNWSVVARETCSKCGKKFDVRAKDVLEFLKKEGVSRLPTQCRVCSAPPPVKKAPRKTCLTFRPFEALKMGQKCEKQGYSLG
jgi:hypothetical protein